MRYWWVNQNQTYQHEVPGGFLWSPKRKTDGHRNPFYEFMREVAPGDLVFSFCDARIRAVGIDKTAPRGPLLTIESSRATRLGSAMPLTPIGSGELSSIDWVHANPPSLGLLQERAGISAPTQEDLESMLAAYCRQQPVPDEWRANVQSLLGVPVPDGD